MAKAVKKVIKKRRDRKNIEAGHAHIRSTFNNTIVTITDVQGNTLPMRLRQQQKQQLRALWNTA